MRTKLYNLRTEKVWERTFKSGEAVQAADILEREYQYLYSEGANFIFMDQESYEQIEVDASIVGETKYWLEGKRLQNVVLEWRSL